MKSLLSFVLLFLPINGFTQIIHLDTIQRIRIIDHQNFNFEWYCGRVYEILKNEGSYEMYLAEQYNKPFFFDVPEKNIEEDSLDLSESKLLQDLEITSDHDSAVMLAIKQLLASINTGQAASTLKTPMNARRLNLLARSNSLHSSMLSTTKVQDIPRT
ncbi:MAG: hypothetical protein ACFB0B_03960 [Thermonemataceae bacterium]